MHLPAYPLWVWVIVATPFLVWLGLWVTVRLGRVSLKPLKAWLRRSMFVLAPAYFVLQLLDDHKVLRAGFGAVFLACWGMLIWLQNLYMFETLRAPREKWYSRRKSAGFFIPTTMRILVQDLDSESPWVCRETWPAQTG